MNVEYDAHLGTNRSHTVLGAVVDCSCGVSVNSGGGCLTLATVDEKK